MELENRTRLEAALLRGDLPDGEQTLAVVVAKASGVIDARGRMQLDLDLRTPVCHEPVAHPDGQIPNDLAPRKHGFEVLALGQAYHPEVDGGAESEITVRVQGDRRSLSVFGERYWYRSQGGDWRMSEPEAFSLLSVSLRNAFGGSSFDAQGNECPYPFNQEGKGFIACDEAVDGSALPNLEHPKQRIQSWQDQPRPCSVAPVPRLLAIEPEHLAADLQSARERGEAYRVPATLWNDALPHFRFGAAVPGAEVALEGMSERPLRGLLPSFRVWAEARVGERALRVPVALDTLLWLPEEQRVLFTFRGSFRYRFVPRETRCVRLMLEE